MIPEGRALLALAGDCGCPAVRVGRTWVRGERGWQRALFGDRPAVHRERAAMFRQLERPLLACTDGGRQRLRRWLDRERTAPTTDAPAWLLAQWCCERVSYYGDPSLLPVIGRALAKLPRPVRAAAVEEITFLGVGCETRGWTGSSHLLDRDGVQRPRLVVLSGAPPHVADLERIVLHEIGHVWLSAPSHEPSQLISAAARRGFMRSPRARGGSPRRGACREG